MFSIPDGELLEVCGKDPSEVPGEISFIPFEGDSTSFSRIATATQMNASKQAGSRLKSAVLPGGVFRYYQGNATQTSVGTMFCKKGRWQGNVRTYSSDRHTAPARRVLHTTSPPTRDCRVDVSSAELPCPLGAPCPGRLVRTGSSASLHRKPAHANSRAIYSSGSGVAQEAWPSLSR